MKKLLSTTSVLAFLTVAGIFTHQAAASELDDVAVGVVTGGAGIKRSLERGLDPLLTHVLAKSGKEGMLFPWGTVVQPHSRLQFTLAESSPADSVDLTQINSLRVVLTVPATVTDNMDLELAVEGGGAGKPSSVKVSIPQQEDVFTPTARAWFALIAREAGGKVTCNIPVGLPPAIRDQLEKNTLDAVKTARNLEELRTELKEAEERVAAVKKSSDQKVRLLEDRLRESAEAAKVHEGALEALRAQLSDEATQAAKAHETALAAVKAELEAANAKATEMNAAHKAALEALRVELEAANASATKAAADKDAAHKAALEALRVELEAANASATKAAADKDTEHQEALAAARAELEAAVAEMNEALTVAQAAAKAHEGTIAQLQAQLTATQSSVQDNGAGAEEQQEAYVVPQEDYVAPQPSRVVHMAP